MDSKKSTHEMELDCEPHDTISHRTRSAINKGFESTPSMQQDPATGRTHYFLRPRDAKKHINYTEFRSDGDDDTDSSYGDEEENDLVITISQMKKCRNSTSQEPDVYAGPPNAELPCVPFPVNGFQDLFRLATLCTKEGKMFKDCQKLPLIYPVLEELNDMIGLGKTKDGLCSLILFELQNLPSYWRHIVLTGAPGLGKSSCASIIAKVLNRLGRSTTDEITVGNPLNMISDWEGQTKTEVNNVVQEALSKSGVLLIDEAPSLNDNRRNSSGDNYGKKCLDMLMQLMDKYQNELIIILAGYREEMERNILQSNKGMRRRIQWFFHLDDYTPEELCQIFCQKLSKSGLQLPPHSQFNTEWFTVHYADFPFFGGSIENFVHKIRNVQTKKTFGQTDKTFIADATIEEGFLLYLKFVIEPMREEKSLYDAEKNQEMLMNQHRSPVMAPVGTGAAPQFPMLGGLPMPFLMGQVNRMMTAQHASSRTPHVSHTPPFGKSPGFQAVSQLGHAPKVLRMSDEVYPESDEDDLPPLSP